MNKIVLFLTLQIISIFSFAQKKEMPFKGNSSPTYEELIAAYQQLDALSEFATLLSPTPNFYYLVIDKNKNLSNYVEQSIKKYSMN